MAYKPIVYINGPVGKNFNVRVAYTDPRSNWLASIPQYSEESGWKVQLSENGRHMKVGDSDYEHLFYDFRFFPSQFQNTRGFCKSRNETITEMVRLMDQLQFEKYEINHFLEEWRIKMPQQPVCVFPQGNEQLDSVVKLTTTPKVDLTTRVLFVVVPEEALSKVSTQFSKRPTEVWVPEKPKRKVAQVIKTTLREWGISFHIEDSSKASSKH